MRIFFEAILALIVLILMLAFMPILTPVFAQGAKNYMAIDKDEIIRGVLKIDIDFSSGAFDGGFGVFVDANHIVTGALDTRLGHPRDIKIKLNDDGLLICVAKAQLIRSDEHLTLLKITHYTDDYCNFSHKKYYHKLLINESIISALKPTRLHSRSPFLIKNARQTQNIEQGFPYFDENGAFLGLSSNKQIISSARVYEFANSAW